MTRKFPKPDSKGRSTGPMNDPRQGPSAWNGPWTSIGQELLESYAWRALSDVGRKVVDRVVLEHIWHGGNTNGELAISYRQFVSYGIRKSSISLGIAEARALGLLERPDPGRKSYGLFKGASAVYSLTWFGRRDGTAPANTWKRFKSLAQAKATATAARNYAKADWAPRREAPSKRRLETERNSYATAAE